MCLHLQQRQHIFYVENVDKMNQTMIKITSDPTILRVSFLMFKYMFSSYTYIHIFRSKLNQMIVYFLCKYSLFLHENANSLKVKVLSFSSFAFPRVRCWVNFCKVVRWKSSHHWHPELPSLLFVHWGWPSEFKYANGSTHWTFIDHLLCIWPLCQALGSPEPSSNVSCTRVQWERTLYKQIILTQVKTKSKTLVK